MDSNNLATLFGPNILHKAKGGLEKDFQVENSDRAEESRDIISIVKEMIENYIRIFTVSTKISCDVKHYKSIIKITVYFSISKL